MAIYKIFDGDSIIIKNNSLNKEEKSKNNNINSEIEKDKQFYLLKKENEELKEKLEKSKSLIKDIKYKLEKTLLNNTKSEDNKLNIIKDELEEFNNYLEITKNSSEKYNNKSDEEENNSKKEEDELGNCLIKLFICKNIIIAQEEDLKEKNSKIENLENKIKELEDNLDIMHKKENFINSMPSLSLPNDEVKDDQNQVNKENNQEEKDKLYKEKKELSNFINDLKKMNVEYFTYQDYLFWAYINQRPLVIQGIFNTVVLTRFGFSWSRENGFKLR